MKNEIAMGTLLGLLVAGPAMLSGQTRTVPPAGAFPDLVGALQSSPGCVGVETARTSSGKQVIFAWFENKKAVMTWYHSDAHIASLRMVGAGPSMHPMADVPDDGQPILAIASLTFAAPPQGGGSPMTISQIAIELYRPLPGGIAAGGRFAPATLNVPGLRDVAFGAPKPASQDVRD
jgi:hypothetical protein